MGADGTISIYNSHGTVDVIGDVTCWIGNAADTGHDEHIQAVMPTRILDTRLTTLPPPWAQLPLL